jgi:TonB family protein
MSKLWKVVFCLFVATLVRVPSSSASARAYVAPSRTGEPARVVSEQASSEAKQAEFNLEPIETLTAIYPPAARDQKCQGKVVVLFVVSETGEVGFFQVVNGDPLLAKAAQEAAMKWKFKPVVRDGKTAPASAEATFNFVLTDGVPDSKGVDLSITPATLLPQSVRVSQGVATGMLLHRVAPAYPQGARALRVEGTVVLQARIGKDGKISDLQLISGPKQLVQAAIDAVKQWQYKPYSFMGNPVEVETQVQVNFSLAGGY